MAYLNKHILCLFICLTVSGCAGVHKGPVGIGEPGKGVSMENRVVLETTQGNIELDLMPEVAPKACENFIALVKSGYYDGIIFHRIIKGFMIQGGDPTGTGNGGASVWGVPFEDEVSETVGFDSPGILAMANSGPNTNGSQFFITTKETSWLNMKHTIFGKVVKGQDVLEKLESVSMDSDDRPVVEQKIIKASVL